MKMAMPGYLPPRATWLFVAATVALARGGTLRLSSSARGADLEDQRTREQVLADDQSFWTAQANATQLALTSFESALHRAQPTSHTASGLQLGTNALQGHRGAKFDVATASPSDDTTAELAPMAAMLDSLYEDSKKRIVELNQREDKSKHFFTVRQGAHDKRLADIRAEFQKHHASAALEANDSALEAHLEDENDFFMKYWTRVRERSHRQFHTFLKIQHGLMQNLKSMSDMYRQAEAGKAPEQQAVGVAFLQGYRAKRTEALAFTQSALAEVVAGRTELAHWD
jgi:hypothetical protein